jgi:hypothetical protein
VNDMDDLDRPVVSPSIKDAIDHAFDGVQGRGALVVIADEQGTRAHLAANLNGHWKVAAGAGFDWATRKPNGYVAVQAVW